MSNSTIKVLNFSKNVAKEVVPGALYITPVIGERLSVALMRFIDVGGDNNVAGKPNLHGEEISLILRGGADIYTPGAERTVLAPSIAVIPANIPHSGINHYDKDGVSLRINVVTPPRAGLDRATPYYPTASEDEKRQKPDAATLDISQSVIVYDLANGNWEKGVRTIQTDKMTIILTKLQEGDDRQPFHSAYENERVDIIVKGGLVLKDESQTQRLLAPFAVWSPVSVGNSDSQFDLLFENDEFESVSITLPEP